MGTINTQLSQNDQNFGKKFTKNLVYTGLASLVVFGGDALLKSKGIEVPHQDYLLALPILAGGLRGSKIIRESIDNIYETLAQKPTINEMEWNRSYEGTGILSGMVGLAYGSLATVAGYIAGNAAIDNINKFF